MSSSHHVMYTVVFMFKLVMADRVSPLEQFQQIGQGMKRRVQKPNHTKEFPAR